MGLLQEVMLVCILGVHIHKNQGIVLISIISITQLVD